MSIVLTPEQETRVKQRAARMGKPLEVVLDEWLDGGSETEEIADRPKANGDRTLALLEQWKAEDALMTDEEREQERRDGEALLASLEANRFTLRELVSDEQAA